MAPCPRLFEQALDDPRFETFRSFITAPMPRPSIRRKCVDKFVTIKLFAVAKTAEHQRRVAIALELVLALAAIALIV
jgi:hypothetical protein